MLTSWPAGIKSTPVAAGKIDLATGMMSREDIITDKDGNIVERRHHTPTLWEAHDTRVFLPPSFSVPDSPTSSSAEAPSVVVSSPSSESGSILEKKRHPPTPAKIPSASASSKVEVSTPAMPPELDDEGSGDEGKEGRGEKREELEPTFSLKKKLSIKQKQQLEGFTLKGKNPGTCLSG